MVPDNLPIGTRLWHWDEASGEVLPASIVNTFDVRDNPTVLYRVRAQRLDGTHSWTGAAQTSHLFLSRAAAVSEALMYLANKQVKLLQEQQRVTYQGERLLSCLRSLHATINFNQSDLDDVKPEV